MSSVGKRCAIVGTHRMFAFVAGSGRDTARKSSRDKRRGQPSALCFPAAFLLAIVRWFRIGEVSGHCTWPLLVVTMQFQPWPCEGRMLLECFLSLAQVVKLLLEHHGEASARSRCLASSQNGFMGAQAKNKLSRKRTLGTSS